MDSTSSTETEMQKGTSSPGVSKGPVTKAHPFPKDDEHIDLEHINIKFTGIHLDKDHVLRNPSVPLLYENALKYEKGTAVSSTGALMCYSGSRTGRSPKDKRVVDEESTSKDIWWGPVNIKLQEKQFAISRERAIDYLNTCKRLYVIDAFAGWNKKYRIKVRVITSRAYHALFMRDMMVLPTREELVDFGEPDFTVFNAGDFPANRLTLGMTSNACVALNFKSREMVILGTQYAGEMKKGIFTVMHYYMPKLGALSLHSSANEGETGDVSLFFGLSGTGKTTLSADPRRKLIGDDEHVWYEDGIFNIEGGCYAKTIKLSAETEPEIFNAIRFSAVLENVIYNPISREVDYDDCSITQNTRVAYPITHIPNSKIPCVGTHPSNLILLTCDAFGVLPPVALLTPEQTMYYFISGYTAKVEGTEVGITEPEATFSACFGDAFLAWHPSKYAELLAQKMRAHKANAWLINTGWSGGSYGVGSRIKLRFTRAMIDAIHNGELLKNDSWYDFPVFNLKVPTKVTGVPDDILYPNRSWKDQTAFTASLNKVAGLFINNFKQFSATSEKSKEIETAGPVLPK